MGIAVSQHVTQVVQGHGVVGVLLQHLAECLFGQVVFLLPLVERALQEYDVLFFFRAFGKLFCFGQGIFSFLPALETRMNLGKANVGLPVFRRILQQGFGHLDGLICFAAIRQL